VKERICWRVVSIIGVILQLATGRAYALDNLQVDLVPLGLRARNEAPIPVEARFNWDSTRLLEGRLEMEFHEGDRVLGRYLSGDLALTSGSKNFRCYCRQRRRHSRTRKWKCR
jgi:hypothetical protein